MKSINIYRHQNNINREIIEKYAEEKGVIFPSDYINLLSKYNFLRLKNCWFNFINPLQGQFKYDERDISFMGYSEDKTYHIPSLISSLIYKSITNGIADNTNYGNKIIAFGKCANGDEVCFDYRKNIYDPKIILMLHDTYEKNELGEIKMLLIPIADSFDEFMDMLYEDEDDEEL